MGTIRRFQEFMDRVFLKAPFIRHAAEDADQHRQLSDYRDTGAQKTLRFREKGGKDREIPVRHDLQNWIDEYLAAARFAGDHKAAPLFSARLKVKRSNSKQRGLAIILFAG